MIDSPTVTFGRTLMILIFVILLPSYAYTDGTRGDAERATTDEIEMTGNVLKDRHFQLKQKAGEEKDVAKKCGILHDARDLLAAYRILRTRFGELEAIKPGYFERLGDLIAVECADVIVGSTQAAACPLGPFVAYPVGTDPKDGGVHRVNGLTLEFLYMTSEQRKEFERQLSPSTGYALSRWLAENFDTAQEIANDIGISLKLDTSLSEEHRLVPSFDEYLDKLSDTSLASSGELFRFSVNNCSYGAYDVGVLGGGVHRPNEFTLGFLYLSEEQRGAFENELSPATRYALGDWINANYHEAEIIANDIGMNLNLDNSLAPEYELAPDLHDFIFRWRQSYEIGPEIDGLH